MTNDKKAFIQELQKTFRAAMGLADAAATAMIDDSGLSLIDMNHHLQYTEKCLVTTKRMVDQEYSKHKKGAPLPTDQEFIEVGEKVMVNGKLVKCVWAAFNLTTDYYAELGERTSMNPTTIVLKNGKFIVTTQRTQKETDHIHVKNKDGVRRTVLALPTNQD